MDGVREVCEERDAYEANFGERPAGDITEVDASDIPDFDILFGGFPCQAFSICGLQGFPDTFKIVVSDAQTRKQAGNAIPVDMVAHVIERFLPMAF